MLNEATTIRVVKHNGEAAGSVPATLRIIIMPRAMTRTAYWVCIAVIGASLAGCAETTYPTLPGLPSGGDSLLTPTQQEKAIKDLERSQTGEQDKPTSGR
jgi:hypothetical protein